MKITARIEPREFAPESPLRKLAVGIDGRWEISAWLQTATAEQFVAEIARLNHLAEALTITRGYIQKLLTEEKPQYCQPEPPDPDLVAIAEAGT